MSFFNYKHSYKPGCVDKAILLVMIYIVLVKYELK